MERSHPFLQRRYGKYQRALERMPAKVRGGPSGPLDETGFPSPAPASGRFRTGTLSKAARRLKRTGRAVAGSAAAAVLAAGLILSAPPAPDAKTVAAALNPPVSVSIQADIEPDALPAEDGQKKRSSRFGLNLRDGALAALSLLATGLLQTLLSLLRSLLKVAAGLPIAGLLGFLGEWMIALVVLALLFGWLFKKLFPEKKLKAFFTGRNLLLLAGASLLITVSRTALLRDDPTAALWYTLLHAFLTLSVLLGAYLLLFHRAGERSRTIQSLCSGKAGLRALGLCCLWTIVSALLRLASLQNEGLSRYGAFLMLWFIVLGAGMLLGRAVMGPDGRTGRSNA